MASKVIQVLKLEAYEFYLYGSWDFADMIKLRILKSLAWIIWLGPQCNRKCPYKSNEEGDLTIEEV